MLKGLRKVTQFVLLIVTVGTLTSCESMKFYSQSVVGHSQVLLKQEPIVAVVNDPKTDPNVRAKLKLVEQARVFGINELKLPNNGSYLQYVDLERPYVVWNVVATKPYEIRPIKHCFPVAGCVPYRGYFNKPAAEAYGRELRKKGYDVIVIGAPAYSTLGWFADPVLSTMLRRSDLGLVGLIFHELAHQEVYAEGDAAFNESFATTVERVGVQKWLATFKEGEYSKAVLEHWEQREKEAEVVELILKHREKIREAYQAIPATDTKALAAAKKAGFDALRADYLALRKRGGGTVGYDRWFKKPMNNASLVLFGAYHGFVNAFEQLLKESNGDWTVFYAKVKALKELNIQERRKRLKALNAIKQ